MKFKVVAGKHHDLASGKVYRTGQTFESDKPMDEIFKNKFDRMDGSSSVPSKRSVRQRKSEPRDLKIKAIKKDEDIYDVIDLANGSSILDGEYVSREEAIEIKRKG